MFDNPEQQRKYEEWVEYKSKYPIILDPKECKIVTRKIQLANLDKWIVGILHKVHSKRRSFQGNLFFCPECEQLFPETLIVQRINLFHILNKYKV